MQKFLLSSIAITLLLTNSVWSAKSTLTEQQAQKIAIDAYVYGYPLITMDMTRQVMTNTVKPEGTHAPMGQFANLREYPTPDFKDITAPNADTLYSVAWLDTSKEPYVLHVPGEGSRYYLMPMLSGWTDVFTAPGTRTTGDKEQNILIVGPGWKGKAPKDMTVVHSPTNMVWILGRTYCAGTKEDYAAVHALQDQYSLTPLSAYGKDYTPPEGIVNSEVDMKTPVRDQVNALDAATYFKRLALLMKQNPPAKVDSAMLAKLAKIGIVPGQDFDMSKLDAVVAKQLNASVKPAQAAILAQEKKAGTIRNGWMFTTKTGLYGTDYLQRAFITWFGLGANRPQDAIYPSAFTDNAGNKLDGANKYVIHFDKGQMPPVKGFWSLTMYNAQNFFVANPLNRYTLSSRDKLVENADGSTDLYIQNESPGKDKEANWLPAPTGNFVLMFRFYWPEAAILNGKWDIPPVKKV